MATSQFNDALHFFALGHTAGVRPNSYVGYKSNFTPRYSISENNGCMDVESAPASAYEAKEAEFASMQMDNRNAMEMDMDDSVFIPTKRQRVQSSMIHGQPSRFRCRVR